MSSDLEFAKMYEKVWRRLFHVMTVQSGSAAMPRGSHKTQPG